MDNLYAIDVLLLSAPGRYDQGQTRLLLVESFTSPYDNTPWCDFNCLFYLKKFYIRLMKIRSLGLWHIG